jgi:hypothetical protein
MNVNENAEKVDKMSNPGPRVFFPNSLTTTSLYNNVHRFSASQLSIHLPQSGGSALLAL